MAQCHWVNPDTRVRCRDIAVKQVEMHREPIHVEVPVCQPHLTEFNRRRARRNQRAAQLRTEQ